MIDVSGAFLNAVLDEPYYARPPEGYRKPGMLRQVHKYLYGDKRAPRGWQDLFEEVVSQVGLQRLVTEPGAFVNVERGVFMIVHVDDMYISAGKRVLQELVQFFSNPFKLKRVDFLERGAPFSFLGDEITLYDDKVTIRTKDEYVDNMLNIMGMTGCRTVDTPMVPKEASDEYDNEPLEPEVQKKFQMVVGILMYYRRHRYDLHYAAKSLAMRASAATGVDMKRLKRVLRGLVPWSWCSLQTEAGRTSSWAGPTQAGRTTRGRGGARRAVFWRSTARVCMHGAVRRHWWRRAARSRSFTRRRRVRRSSFGCAPSWANWASG